VIRRITENITTLSAPFWRFGQLKIGGRGTLVRLPTGSVAVFSPTALTPEVKETVSALGEVKYIAALDIEHHIFLGPWHEAYPQAKVIGVEGLPEKRESQKNEKVPFSVVFTKANKDSIQVDPEFDSAFDYEYFDAHMNKELVFFYKPERTLIEADLMFNLPAMEQFSKTDETATSGVLTKLFTYFNNTQGSAMGQRRLIWHGISNANKDREGFNASVAKVKGWDFDRIIPCHGDVIESGGKGIFEKVFEWHLQGLKKSS